MYVAHPRIWVVSPNCLDGAVHDRITTLRYDTVGRLDKRIDLFVNGAFESLRPDEDRITTYAYDPLDYPATIIRNSVDGDPSTNAAATDTDIVTRYTYDRVGNLRTVTDPLNHVQDLTYDALDRVRKRVDNYANGTHDAGEAADVDVVTTEDYDQFGQLVAHTDAANLKTTSAYNGVGQVTTTLVNAQSGQAADNQTNVKTQYAYNVMGGVVQEIDPRGQITTTQRDYLGRPVDVRTQRSPTDASAETLIKYGYDRNNVARWSKSVVTTLFDVDALGRGVATIQAYIDGNTSTTELDTDLTTRQTYDAAGRVIASTNPNGITTEYSYTDADTLQQVIGNVQDHAFNPSVPDDDVPTAFTYDRAGNQLTMLDANNHSWQARYDALDRPLGTTDPLSRSETRSYDRGDRLTGQVRADSAQLSYAYDNLDRLTALRYPDPAQPAQQAVTSYTYREDGLRLSMQDTAASGATTQTSYGYDALKRLTSVAQPNVGTIGYRYDAAGLRDQVQYPGGPTLDYAYSASRQLTQVLQGGTQLVGYTYTSDGRMNFETRRAGEVSLSYNYDGARRERRVRNSASGAPVDIQTTYDRAGQPIQVVENLAAPNGTATNTPTATTGGPTASATNTPTATATGPTATPTRTATSGATTATNTATATATPTATAAGATATPTATSTGGGSLYYNVDLSAGRFIEAETYSTKVGTNFRSVSDATRSNGLYMDTPNSSGATASSDYLTYDLEVTNGGTANIYLLSSGPDGGSDSFMVSVDGTGDNQVTTGSNAWVWKKPSVSFSLNTGQHTLYVKARDNEDGAQVDKLYIVIGSTAPTGNGATALTPSTRGGGATATPTATSPAATATNTATTTPTASATATRTNTATATSAGATATATATPVPATATNTATRTSTATNTATTAPATNTATPTATSAGGGSLYYNLDLSSGRSIEAETYSTKVGTNFRSVSDATRSNGLYMDTPNGSGANQTSDYLTYDLEVTNGGAANVYLLSNGPDGSSDSFMVNVDGLGDNQVTTGSNAWVWKKPSVSFNLSTGQHTLYVKARTGEDGAQVDKLYIVIGSTAPTGNGSTALTPSTRGGGGGMAVPYQLAAARRGPVPAVVHARVAPVAAQPQAPTPTTNTITYAYDKLQRLLTASESTGDSYAYRYDAVGNRTSATRNGASVAYSFDTANQLTSAGGTAISYDANGRLIGDGARTYRYDARDRLVQVLGTGAADYRYNGDGALVGQTQGGSTTDYTQDVGAPLSEVLQARQGLHHHQLPLRHRALRRARRQHTHGGAARHARLHAPDHGRGGKHPECAALRPLRPPAEWHAAAAVRLRGRDAEQRLRARQSAGALVPAPARRVREQRPVRGQREPASEPAPLRLRPKQSHALHRPKRAVRRLAVG